MLQSLTLRHHNPMSRATLELLSEVPAPDLESLSLGVLAVNEEVTLPDFAQMQRHIKPTWMVSLKEERILYSGTLADDVLLHRLRRDLPVLHAHGTLKVVRP